MDTNFRINRSWIKTVILGMLTLGIYPLVMYHHITQEINFVCMKDGKKTMDFLLVTFIVAPITAGIGAVVWQHRICNRMGDELKRRAIDLEFSAKDFWKTCFWGMLLAVAAVIMTSIEASGAELGVLSIISFVLMIVASILVIIFESKFLKAMNALNEHYNSHEKMEPRPYY
ncbi:MAG: DUF4234 domain-containing protein [Clostridia bacterium]|nr:DUF4234 domain-containing protein [Clostridia bacterium]